MMKFSKLRSLFGYTRRFGAGAAFRLMVERIGRPLVGLNVVQVVWLTPERVTLGDPEETGCEFRFLTADEVARFAADPGNGLEEACITRARGGKHLCFAALDGARLAAYGWYAFRSIEPEHCFGFGLAYPDDVAYMYKGFTHPSCRGRRLHGFVMGLALRDLKRYGVTRLISTIDWTNAPSIRSCRRIGYETLGSLVRWKLGGGERVRVPAAVRDNEVHVSTG